jgi:CRISPR-associated endonuclease/helicase Cas3
LTSCLQYARISPDVNAFCIVVKSMRFDDFFQSTTGHCEGPFDYQCRLAGGDSGTVCRSQLINIPTGLGKTAAVVLAWLWNRVELKKTDWPRRLVYCLPMRTLVEQTQTEVQKWLKTLLNKSVELGIEGQPLEDLKWLAENSPVILMGGEDAGEWDVHPEKPAILIGTQDMLLSRALNRGYGMSRYRWPMHFGLLNNDALWVMDETQLMGPGLNTACQLEAFRISNASESVPQGYGSIPEIGSVTWYISATASVDHLKTREWRDATRPPEFVFDLIPAEKTATSGPVHQRRFATKVLERDPVSNFGESNPSALIIAAILARHDQMLASLASDPKLPARTLIICNTVDRAVSVHAALASGKPMGCDLLLLHSRFRRPEREEQMKRLKSTDLAVFPKGQFVVATQVIEAGVDLSSAILWSEVAPLASLVQRLGRLNRSGEFSHDGWKPVAIIIGVGVQAAPVPETKEAREEREKKNARRCLPYELPACEAAWESLRKLNGTAAPANLEQIQDDIVASIPRCPYSLQRHELLDFFDTDANLSLGFTDVSPFVRGLDEDTDLQVLWRDAWPENDGKPDFVPDFQRDELCSVPFRKARDARNILDQGWLWRGKESGWISVRDSGIAPGMTILLPLSAGGYDVDAGWTGEATDNKHLSHYQAADEPSDEELLSCLANGWRNIAVHTAEVAAELARIWKTTIAEGAYAAEHEAFIAAVPWHDVGKNHPGWQQAVVAALKAAGITGKEEHIPFAKFSLSDSPTLRNKDGSPRFSGKELKREVNCLRRSFRPRIAHEIASALAFRQSEQARFGTDLPLSSLLAEYLIMMHHGRVRKVLRDEIPRFPKDTKDSDTVRGVVHGSDIPAVIIDGKSLGCASLSTDCRRMGRDTAGNESYTRGVLRLLEHYGPFRLAYFEALFRAADVRASKAASKKPNA